MVVLSFIWMQLRQPKNFYLWLKGLTRTATLTLIIIKGIYYYILFYTSTSFHFYKDIYLSMNASIRINFISQSILQIQRSCKSTSSYGWCKKSHRFRDKIEQIRTVLISLTILLVVVVELFRYFKSNKIIWFDSNIYVGLLFGTAKLVRKQKIFSLLFVDMKQMNGLLFWIYFTSFFHTIL